MPTRIAGIAAAALIAATVGCSSSEVTVPALHEAQGLRLESTLSRSDIAQGQSAEAVFRLTNTSGGPITLHFGSSCQIMPYVETALGAIVHPAGGGWGCLAVLTELTLAAGESKAVTLPVRAGSATRFDAGTLVLARGVYRFYARLDSGIAPDAGVRLRSADAVLTVR